MLLTVYRVQDGLLSGPDDRWIEMLEVLDWVDFDDFIDTRVLLDDSESVHFVVWNLDSLENLVPELVHVVDMLLIRMSLSETLLLKCNVVLKLLFLNNGTSIPLLMSIFGRIFCVIELTSSGCGATALAVCRRDALLLNSILGCTTQAIPITNIQNRPNHLF